MKRLFALGLVLAGLLAVPGAARAWNGRAPAPSVLGALMTSGLSRACRGAPWKMISPRSMA